MAQNRGRMQVQGRDLSTDLSWRWNQQRPPRARTALYRLQSLRKRLTPRETRVRDEAFAKAERWIQQVRDQGGIAAPVLRTFQNRNLPRHCRDARIDIEILTGTAFRRSILSS